MSNSRGDEEFYQQGPMTQNEYNTLSRAKMSRSEVTADVKLHDLKLAFFERDTALENYRREKRDHEKALIKNIELQNQLNRCTNEIERLHQRAWIRNVENYTESNSVSKSKSRTKTPTSVRNRIQRSPHFLRSIEKMERAFQIARGGRTVGAY